MVGVDIMDLPVTEVGNRHVVVFQDFLTKWPLVFPAYHPQTDGMVERFNRNLKTVLRKHADKLGSLWDTYLPGVLWAYGDTPHAATGEKPSFLLFGLDCRTPTEAAFWPPAQLQVADVEDYRQELIVSLSSARELQQRVNKQLRESIRDSSTRR